MEQIQWETTINPAEDTNKLDDKELAKRKSIRDEFFGKNQKRKDGPTFVYDVQQGPADGLAQIPDSACRYLDNEIDVEIWVQM
ncbi:centrosomal protein of 19 kDa [Sigmodon hispidus]